MNNQQTAPGGTQHNSPPPGGPRGGGRGGGANGGGGTTGGARTNGGANGGATRVQIMAVWQEEVLLVADGHHKEVSGDALAADTNRKHHHRSFSVEEWERPPLG